MAISTEHRSKFGAGNGDVSKWVKNFRVEKKNKTRDTHVCCRGGTTCFNDLCLLWDRTQISSMKVEQVVLSHRGDFHFRMKGGKN